MKTFNEQRVGYFHSVSIDPVFQREGELRDFDPWLAPMILRGGHSLTLFQINVGDVYMLLFYRRQNNDNRLECEHGFASWQLPFSRLRGNKL